MQTAEEPEPPNRRHIPTRIVSGGQTGVDRGALDAAIAVGIDHGGWCPRGRRAEDGTIPSRYRLQELDDPGYPARTEQNVIDSDATLILYRDQLVGGTLLTKRLCQKHRMRHRCFSVSEGNASPAQAIAAWLDEIRADCLNVAGPRESSAPGIQVETEQLITRVLARAT
ncbi:MAG: putative molybdenum carrier protein [Planctomycetota bacterium]